MDHQLFDFVNQSLAHPWLDAVLPAVRHKLTWVPLYVFMVGLLYRAYGLRRTLYLLLCVAVVLAVADQLAATVLKPWVGRLRPCAEPAVADHARALVGCGGRFSFPSNHATNHFALATLLNLTWLRNRPAGWRWALLGWAALICFAQVYVGKHYPGDVVGGGLLGAGLAWLGTYCYRRWAGADAIPAASPPATHLP